MSRSKIKVIFFGFISVTSLKEDLTCLEKEKEDAGIKL